MRVVLWAADKEADHKKWFYLVLSKSGRRVVTASPMKKPINHSYVISQKKLPFKTVPSLTGSVH